MKHGYEKLEMFERKIMSKAQEECSKIEQETAQMKQVALEQEENRLLENLYRHIQSQIAQIRTENVKEVSKETAALKKELYQQREQYVTEILSRARAELVLFTKGEKYEQYMYAQAEKLHAEYPSKEEICLLVREQDLPLAAKIQAAFGADCAVKPDRRITIGGIILHDASNGIESDRTLDAALESQRAWLSAQSGLQFELAKNN